MLILMKADHTLAQREQVVAKIKALGLTPHIIPGQNHVAIGITGNPRALNPDEFLCIEGVGDAIKVTKPYKLASREFYPEQRQVKVGNLTFGDGHFIIIAGPCAVESQEHILRMAGIVKAAGAHVLRGGTFKPRSSPYAFQGLGEAGLRYLKEASLKTGLLTITEATDVHNLELVASYTDIVQIGARNMHNFSLLQEAGRLTNPILLKRGLSATIEEWLMSAEYILSSGNPNVILCERGIRSFDPSTRNVLDICSVSLVRELSNLPVIVDPSHATGRRSLVVPAALAGFAIGAHGLIIETHDNPEKALVDGPQSIDPTQLTSVIRTIRSLAPTLGVCLPTL